MNVLDILSTLSPALYSALIPNPTPSSPGCECVCVWIVLLYMFYCTSMYVSLDMCVYICISVHIQNWMPKHLYSMCV